MVLWSLEINSVMMCCFGDGGNGSQYWGFFVVDFGHSKLDKKGNIKSCSVHQSRL